MNARLTFLGTGTSMGVPTLGCECSVCRSTDTRNTRTRSSIALEYNSHVVVIDTGPDFRQQMLRRGLRNVDAVLYTHGHADHVLGFDDLRPLTLGRKELTPVYADNATADVLERVFEYTFRKVDRYPTSARVALHRVSADPGTTIELFGVVFERVPVIHGRTSIAGYRFGEAAYLTDMSDIPAETLQRLQGLDVVVLDALRHEPHPSHSHLAKSIEFARAIGARRTYFTHIAHEIDHAAVAAELPTGIELAYDGLQVEFAIA